MKILKTEKQTVSNDNVKKEEGIDIKLDFGYLEKENRGAILCIRQKTAMPWNALPELNGIVTMPTVEPNV